MSPKVIITPKQKNKNLIELLTNDQLKYIQNVLEHSCNGAVCISRSRLFKEVKEPLDLTIEQYQFEQIMTTAIRDGHIKGFETRAGKNGGICRKGAFAEYDEKKRKKKQKQQKKSCTVRINDKLYSVNVSSPQALGFITAVLGGEPANDGRSNVSINNGTFKLKNDLKPATILENFLVNIWKASEIKNPEKEEVVKGKTVNE